MPFRYGVFTGSGTVGIPVAAFEKIERETERGM